MNRPALYNSFLVALATTLAAGAATTAAADEAPPPYAAEIRACVDTVYEHIDLAGVERVRHYVAKTRRSRVGYALFIDTTVYDGDTQKEYETYCLAHGSEEPLRFRIGDKAS